jgi:hypothetical protein
MYLFCEIVILACRGSGYGMYLFCEIVEAVGMDVFIL